MERLHLYVSTTDVLFFYPAGASSKGMTAKKQRGIE